MLQITLKITFALPYSSYEVGWCTYIYTNKPRGILEGGHRLSPLVCRLTETTLHILAETETKRDNGFSHVYIHYGLQNG